MQSNCFLSSLGHWLPPLNLIFGLQLILIKLEWNIHFQLFFFRVQTENTKEIESRTHRMVQVGRDFKDNLVPSSLSFFFLFFLTSICRARIIYCGNTENIKNPVKLSDVNRRRERGKKKKPHWRTLYFPFFSHKVNSAWSVVLPVYLEKLDGPYLFNQVTPLSLL